MKKNINLCLVGFILLASSGTASREIVLDPCGPSTELYDSLEELNVLLSSIEKEKELFKTMYELGIGVDPGWRRYPVYWNKQEERVHIFNIGKECDKDGVMYEIQVAVFINDETGACRVDAGILGSVLVRSFPDPNPTLREIILQKF